MITILQPETKLSFLRRFNSLLDSVSGWGCMTSLSFPRRMEYTILYMEKSSNSSKRAKIVPESPKWPMLGHLFGLSSSARIKSLTVLKDAGRSSWTWCFWLCAVRCSAFHSKGRRMWWQLQHTSGPRRYASLRCNGSQSCIQQLAMKPQRMKHKRGHRMAAQIHRIPLIKLNLGTELGSSATPWMSMNDERRFKESEMPTFADGPLQSQHYLECPLFLEQPAARLFDVQYVCLRDASDASDQASRLLLD